MTYSTDLLLQDHDLYVYEDSGPELSPDVQFSNAGSWVKEEKISPSTSASWESTQPFGGRYHRPTPPPLSVSPHGLMLNPPRNGRPLLSTHSPSSPGTESYIPKLSRPIPSAMSRNGMPPTSEGPHPQAPSPHYQAAPRSAPHAPDGSQPPRANAGPGLAFQSSLQAHLPPELFQVLCRRLLVWKASHAAVLRTMDERQQENGELRRHSTWLAAENERLRAENETLQRENERLRRQTGGVMLSATSDIDMDPMDRLAPVNEECEIDFTPHSAPASVFSVFHATAFQSENFGLDSFAKPGPTAPSPVYHSPSGSPANSSSPDNLANGDAETKGRVLVWQT